MRSCATDILDKIDFGDLQREVLEVTSLMLAKREILPDDVLIIENALALWVAALIKNGDLINEFYSFKRDVSQVPPHMLNSTIKDAKDFIAHGLHTFKNTKIRDEFVSSVACICSKVKPVRSLLRSFRHPERSQSCFSWSNSDRTIPRRSSTRS